MQISIIIVNFNTFELTVQCIKSIYAHVTNLTFEVILVDNASSERNPEDFLLLFPNIKLIKSEQNIGFARGNNLGILQSNGDYILLLNSDTELLNNAPLICKIFMDNHSEVGVVGAALYFPDLTIQHNCQRFPSVTYGVLELLRVQKIFGERNGGKILLGAFFKHDVPVYPDWIWGTFFMFRRASLLRLKEQKLPDDFFMYGEDMQWCMEFKKLNLKVAFLPEAKVLHHMGKSGAPKNSMMRTNHERFMKMYYSPLHRAVITMLDKLLQ
jgi:GT2 family glycosyltransferase